MRTRVAVAVLLGLGFAAVPEADAKYWPCHPYPYGGYNVYAPDTFRTCGYYTANCQGMVYGPNYNLQPGFPPVQGVGPPPFGPRPQGPLVPMIYQEQPCFVPPPQAPQAPQAGGYYHPGYTWHKYNRSPRDFFMDP